MSSPPPPLDYRPPNAPPPPGLRRRGSVLLFVFGLSVGLVISAGVWGVGLVSLPNAMRATVFVVLLIKIGVAIAIDPRLRRSGFAPGVFVSIPRAPLARLGLRFAACSGFRL